MMAESARSRSLARGWWREVITVRPDTGGPWSAVRVSVSVTVPLAVVLAAGHPEWSGYAVFGSLSSVYGKHWGYPDRLRAQLGAGAAMTLAVLLGTITGIPGPGSLWAIPAMSAMSVLGFLLTRCRGWLPVPSLFLVFATGTVSSSQHVWGDVIDALAIAIAAALLGVAIGQIGRLIPKNRHKKRTVPHLSPLRHVLQAAGVRAQLLQYAIAPLIAGLAAIALGLGHPYWAAVSATVPIVGKTLEIQLGRATLRILGTAIGIGIGIVLIATGPPMWVLVVEVAVLQVITELLVGRNYGIAVVCITPLALILSHLAAPTTVRDLVTDRLLDTVLGVAVAVLVLSIGHLSAHKFARGG